MSDPARPTTRRAALRALGAGAVAGLAGCLGGRAGAPARGSDPGGSLAGLGPATMYKSPTCTCCDRYAAFLADRDLPVAVQHVQDRRPWWAAYGLPEDYRSCHTIVGERYVVEGHVPGAALAALLAERPDVVGVTLPGMPAGSPGMGGARAAPFVVWALHRDGPPTVFLEV